MASPRIIPALADLTQDIAGPVPLDLLYAWAAEDQDDARAESLLAPFRIDGTVVSSDTSGLSRMTSERDLLDVLALISQPKQIVHDIGIEIGGRAIGTWVADNTQMFYPPEVLPPTVVDAMWEAEHRIATGLPVAIGMCVHRGAFFELGGGLYGADAHIVEWLAELHAGPGEVLVTDAVKSVCPAEYAFRRREGLDISGAVFSVAQAAGMRHLQSPRTPYPHPFPAPFYERLLTFMDADAQEKERVRQQIYENYLCPSVVVFLSRSHSIGASWNGAGLLDDLVANVLLDALVTGVDGVKGHIAGLGGGLGILHFDNAQEALDIAQTLRRRFMANSLGVKIGIAGGPVLLFSNPHGPSGIAGRPVNVASKISEDAGINGRINVAADVASQLPDIGGEPFEVALGGIVLRGISLS